MKLNLRDVKRCGWVAGLALAMLVAWTGMVQAQNLLFSEDFESLELGPNVDEGLTEDDPREAVWSPDGPAGWTVDRTGVPGYGTAADGVIEFAGWNFVDPIWWSQVDPDQGRDSFASDGSTEFVIAVADSDEWDDAFHPPGSMNTFMRTPAISVAGLPANTPLQFLTSWRYEGEQTATVTASFDGGNPVEILRWESNIESDFFQDDLNPEEVSVPLNIPAGAQEVVLEFGYTNGNNNWWWAIDNIAVGDYYEDFESVQLGPNIEEGRAIPVDNVWTKEPPAGWSVEDMVPGMDEDNDFNGVTEWIGWSFANKDWWVSAAGDQRRSEFTLGQGTVMVADPDEWDDAAHPDSASEGWYNTFMSTSEISLVGVDANSVVLEFDSSWRPEYDDNYHQTANITVSYDGGPEEEVMLWESDPNSDFYKDDNSTNETITLQLSNPDGAQSMVIKFGLFDAGNDWWWAIDNIKVYGTGGGGGVTGDFNGDGILDAADINDLTAQVAGGQDVAKYDLNGDSQVNEQDIGVWVKDLFNSWIGDANLDGQFTSSDLVDVLAAGLYEVDADAVWSTGDFDGDGRASSSDLVAALADGGYELGPRAGALAAVPEPSSALLLGLGLLAWAPRRRR
jgi:hypothetical protein